MWNDTSWSFFKILFSSKKTNDKNIFFKEYYDFISWLINMCLEQKV